MIKSYAEKSTLKIHKDVITDYYNRLLYENLNPKTERPVLFSSIEYIILHDTKLQRYEYLTKMLEKAKRSDVILEQLCVSIMVLWAHFE